MILKIISGGQTGADRAALDLAIKMGLPHGGSVPKGRLAEDGRIPDRYNLTEMSTESYPARTEQNVLDADGTLIISHGELSGGSKLTLDLAEKHKRPCLHLDLLKVPGFFSATEVSEWINDNRIEILNVAGPKASGDPKIYDETKKVLESAILLGLTASDPDHQIRDSEKEESLRALPVPPKSVDESVERLLQRMSLKDKATIANMTEGELGGLGKNLGAYIKDAFRLTHNGDLIDSCRARAGRPILSEEDAASVVIKALHEELYRSHRLRLIK